MRNLWSPAKPDRRSSGEDDLQNYGGNAQIKTVGQNTTIAVMLTNRMPVIRKSLRPVWKKWRTKPPYSFHERVRIALCFALCVGCKRSRIRMERNWHKICPNHPNVKWYLKLLTNWLIVREENEVSTQISCEFESHSAHFLSSVVVTELFFLLYPYLIFHVSSFSSTFLYPINFFY